MVGLTQNYITPYALAMDATTTQVGFLTAIPYFAMILTQLLAPVLSEKAGSRKRFILVELISPQSDMAAYFTYSICFSYPSGLVADIICHAV